MIHQLQLEWKKFSRYRVFQVMVGFFLVLLPALFLIPKAITDWPDEIGSADTFYIFPNVFKFLAYTGNWLSFFFLGFVGVLLVTTEVGSKTLRQNIITGLTRGSFFTGKIMFVLAICLIATVYYWIISLIFGFTHTEAIYTSRIMEGVGYSFRFFLMCFGYMTFGVLVGFLIRKTGFALFLYLAYIMFLEPVIRWALHFRYIKGKSMHFYPLNSIEDLGPIPFMEISNQFLKENQFDFLLSANEATITASIYIVLMIGLAYWRFSKMDI